MKPSSPFRAGVNLLLLSTLTLPFGLSAQGNANPQVQMQNVNFYVQGNTDNSINDNNQIQTNLIEQQENPPAQQQKSSGNVFGSEDNSSDQANCKDCEAVKKALKAAHSSSGIHHSKHRGIKTWGTKFSGRMNLKMKKVFAHRHKVRTSYETCFNWH